MRRTDSGWYGESVSASSESLTIGAKFRSISVDVGVSLSRRSRSLLRERLRRSRERDLERERLLRLDELEELDELSPAPPLDAMTPARADANTPECFKQSEQAVQTSERVNIVAQLNSQLKH